MDERPTPRGVLTVIVAASIWGSWSLFLRPSGLPSELTSPLVLLLVGLFSLALVRLDTVVPRWDRKTLLLLAIHSVCGAVNVGTFFASMARTTLAIAVLTHYLAPILVALATPLVEGHRVPRSILAALLATLGLALVLEPWNEGHPPSAFVGALLGATSALGYAGSVFAMRRLVGRIGSMRTQGWHAIVAAVLLSPLVLRVDPSSVTARGLGWVVLGAVFPGTLAGLLFLRGLDRIGSARASILAFFEPMVAVGLGALVFHEHLGAVAIVGAALIVLGGGLVSVPARD